VKRCSLVELNCDHVSALWKRDFRDNFVVRGEEASEAELC